MAALIKDAILRGVFIGFVYATLAAGFDYQSGVNDLVGPFLFKWAIMSVILSSGLFFILKRKQK